jgi:hypothetical protein
MNDFDDLFIIEKESEIISKTPEEYKLMVEKLLIKINTQN